MAERRLRALIVDDEPPARTWVRRQLEGDPDVEIVGEAEDGFAAVSAIEEHEPDLVLLDVQMPGLDGFGVLEMLAGRKLPAIVFITAFDRYAVRAFEVNAIDYLMKPFSRDRFAGTLSKVKAQLEKSAAGAQRLVTHLRQDGRRPEWLLVRAGDRSRFLKLRDVDFVEAAKNSVLLHAGADSYSFRTTMKAMEEALDPGRFLRIHRSTIVNLERVKELEPWFNGEYRVILKDGRILTLSANYRSELARFKSLPDAGEA
ncbi:MAG: response regulator transcription factor [Acidobacteria bacterium]|nr:response regulator transcription factor [Acidobacteriota bacterium]